MPSCRKVLNSEPVLVNFIRGLSQVHSLIKADLLQLVSSLFSWSQKFSVWLVIPPKACGHGDPVAVSLAILVGGRILSGWILICALWRCFQQISESRLYTVVDWGISVSLCCWQFCQICCSNSCLQLPMFSSYKLWLSQVLYKFTSTCQMQGKCNQGRSPTQ